MHGFATLLEKLIGIGTALLTQDGAIVALWFLSAVFLLSGTAKLRRPDLAAVAMVEFGVLQEVRPKAGAAVGLADVGIAGLLAFGPATVALGLASTLLWFFVVLIAHQLYLGRAFACFCFGEAEDKLSRLTLARTLALAIVATLYALSSPAGLARVTPETYLAAISGTAMLGIALLLGAVPSLMKVGRLRRST